jgi:hypothetical protein
MAWIGKDLKEYVAAPDDEQYFAVTEPRRLGRYNIICGNAIVSHFAFNTQRNYLDSTDLLTRYDELSKYSNINVRRSKLL